MRGRLDPALAGALLLFLLLTVAATWPLAARLDSGILDLWDAKLNAWIFHWDWYQTFRDPLQLFHANIFHPARWSLAFSENLYGAAVFGFPMFWAGASPLLVYNTLFLLGMFLSAVAGWALARDVTGDAAASLLAGVVFAFAPWKISQAPHVQYQWSAFLALALLFLLRWLDGRRRRDLVLFALFLLWNACSNVHYGVFSVLLVGLVLSWEAGVRGLRTSRRALLGALLACAAAGVLALPFYLPYREASKEYKMRRSLGEIEHYSRFLRDFTTAGPENKLYAPLTQRWAKPEGNFFPGLIVVALAIGGVVRLRREREKDIERAAPAGTARQRAARILDVLMAAGLVLYAVAGSQEDGLRIAGMSIRDESRVIFLVSLLGLVRLCLAFPRFSRYRDLADFLRRMRVGSRAGLFVAIATLGVVIAFGARLPWWRFLARLGGMFAAIRVPARGIVLFLLALGVLASWGLSRLTRGISPWTRRGAIAAALLLTGIEYRAAPMTVHPLAAEAPPVYRWLAGVSLPGAVVELPLGVDPDFEYEFRSSAHHHPIVNGSSGFFPPLYVEIAQLFEKQPIPDEVWEKLGAAGASLVVFHPDRATDNYARVEWARFVLRAVASGRLAPVAKFPGSDERPDLLLRVTSAGDFPLPVAEAARTAAAMALSRLENELNLLAPPFGALDWPREEEPAHSDSLGYGWALDDSGISEVRVKLAGRSVAVYYGPRPDLPPELAKYPGLKYAGYGFALPKLAPGNYELEVAWVAKDGGITTVTRSIEIRAPSRLPRGAARP